MHPYTPTHTRARAHTRTEICNTYCFPRQRWFRERASLLRYVYIACLVTVAQQPSSGRGRLIIYVSKSYTVRRTYSVGLLWMRDQLVAEAATYTTNRRTSMPSAGFEPAIERPQKARPVQSALHNFLLLLQCGCLLFLTVVDSLSRRSSANRSFRLCLIRKYATFQQFSVLVSCSFW